MALCGCARSGLKCDPVDTSQNTFLLLFFLLFVSVTIEAENMVAVISRQGGFGATVFRLHVNLWARGHCSVRDFTSDIVSRHSK